MSKHNKVNPDHYHQGGRLTPDEMAKERRKQQPQVSENEPANERGSREHPAGGAVKPTRNARKA
jgi:hypothetical protein